MGRIVGPAALLASMLILSIAAASSPAAAPPHDWDRHCGSQNHPGAGWYQVRAYNTACDTARHVARHYWNSGGDRHFEGWSCRDRQIGDEVFRADCKRNRGHHQHVRFTFGA